MKKTKQSQRKPARPSHPLDYLRLPPEAVACLRVVMLLREFEEEIKAIVKGVPLEGSVVEQASDWFGDLAWDFGLAALGAIDKTLPPGQWRNRRIARGIVRKATKAAASHTHHGDVTRQIREAEEKAVQQ